LFDFINTIPVDDVTYTHSLNVSMIAKVFGKWLDLPQARIDDLGVAGLLHDVGKIQIPDAILNKPGKLNPEEYDEIKKHPIYSYRLAQTQNVSKYVLKAILMHHERYDGSGYPTGAKGDQIDLLAKILAVADVYEAMTATRAYRSKICPFKVLDMLEVESYVQFDPRIIGKILENIANSYVGSKVVLNTGQKGSVVFINKRVARPIVEIDGAMFDLSKEEDEKIYIEEVM
jgi:HD-GYP domain-containing protein (c-di-GMP phosphodiesterase class II)